VGAANIFLFGFPVGCSYAFSGLPLFCPSKGVLCFRCFVCCFFLLLLLSATLFASGPFKPVRTYLSGGAHALSVAAADVNGDGKLGIVVSNFSACYACLHGSVGILPGNRGGTFEAAQTYDAGATEPAELRLLM
jgi:hypothetical protein